MLHLHKDEEPVHKRRIVEKIDLEKVFKGVTYDSKHGYYMVKLHMDGKKQQFRIKNKYEANFIHY